MRLLLAVAACLLVALTAGCVGAPGKAMTARDGLADATDAASKWADGKEAKLVASAAVEPFKHATFDSPDGRHHAEYETRLDGSPGDGKAPGWLYGFLAGDRCITVVLAAGLGVLADGYETCNAADVAPSDDGSGARHGERDGPQPLTDWPIDSDKAASILQENHLWPQPAEDITYVWALFQADEHPVWSVIAEAADGNRTVAAVDAENGTVLAIHNGNEWDSIAAEFGGSPAPPGSPGSPGSSPATASSSHKEGQSALVSAAKPFSIDVEIQGRGGSLTAQGSVQANVNGVGMLRFVLTGPNGPVDEQGVSNFAGGTATFQHDGLPPGPYTP